MLHEDLIQYLSRSIGVDGAVLLGATGDILASELSTSFDPAVIPVLFQYGRSALESSREKLPTAYDLRLDTHQLTFFFRDLGGAFLIVVAYDSTKANSVKISMDVVAKRFQNDTLPGPRL
jgi:hypothetical protein